MAYKSIESSFWRDINIRCLSNEAKLLLLFYITAPDSHFTGLFWQPIYVPLNELGWDEEQLLNTLQELNGNKTGMGMDRGMGMGMDRGMDKPMDTQSEEGKKHFFVKFYEKHEIVWVKSMLRYQVGDKPLNTKQLKGVLSHIRQFRRAPVITEFLAHYSSFFLETVRQKEFDMRLCASLFETYKLFGIPFSLESAIPHRYTAAVTAAATATEDKDTLRGAKTPRGAAAGSNKQKPLITQNQIDDIYNQLNGTADLARTFIANLAEDNKSGTVKLSRVYSTLTALLTLKDEHGPERFAYGLTEANTRGAANINYVKKAMQSFNKQRRENDTDVWNEPLQ